MAESKKVVVFRIQGEEYAIPIEFVISIEKIAGITPIPHLPHYVNGIAKVRDELIPVIDLKQVLYHQGTNLEEASRKIVLQTEELSVGIIVDEAKEIIDIPNEAVKPLGLAAYQKTSYFSGVANLNSKLITLIDPSVLVESLEGIKDIKEYMKNQTQMQ
ncbi:chemotaxis protein CheW [Bacillus mesophilum]|uniref:Chemotaxis protein CheW n=1 Tax=Bacillus mesophilum TaxID=1071718 RepID=A0A7V7RMZ8_9BACI|nr:chemotaxis protein CheW [Bacillus mesophilum]KAB2333785.1 chemotaxis protein CheW [Bacillus mesophilum]